MSGWNGMIGWVEHSKKVFFITPRPDAYTLEQQCSTKGVMSDSFDCNQEMYGLVVYWQLLQ